MGIGRQIGGFPRGWPLDEQYRFKLRTQLHLLQHHLGILEFGEWHQAVLHKLLMTAIENGFSDIAVEFRKLGAALKRETEREWEGMFSRNRISFYKNYIWMDFKDPGIATPERLSNALQSRLAVYALGGIQESEKLLDLDDVVEGWQPAQSAFTGHQRWSFLKTLLELGGVSGSIRSEAEEWIKANSHLEVEE